MKRRIFCLCLIILSFTLPTNTQNRPIKIDNIESRLGTITSADIESFIRTFPRGWFSGVKSIKFLPEYKMIDDKLEGLGTYTRSSREIEILNSARGFDPISILNAINHESAHANDWISCADLTSVEREEFGNDILLRIKSPDRLKRRYIEYLEAKGEFIEDIAVEYWAEIALQYFINPGRLTQEDILIIEKHIFKLDPGYDQITTAIEREEITNQIFNNVAEKYLEDMKALR